MHPFAYHGQESFSHREEQAQVVARGAKAQEAGHHEEFMLIGNFDPRRGPALQWADPTLRADRGTMRTAAHQNMKSLQWCTACGRNFDHAHVEGNAC